MQLSTTLLTVAALAIFPEVTVAAGAKCLVQLKNAQDTVVSSFEALAGVRKVVQAKGFKWMCKTAIEDCHPYGCIIPKGLTPVGTVSSSGIPNRATPKLATGNAAALQGAAV
ncbi:uncharacterized protein PpBr36_10050 [Pyricularia pennisetigena]|uniref:uncharacterized protein n=1 Tax=Pyricularia pennisetigena TaxID=1578925 RepID=UPI00115457B4|nr:uncharacterized protein PpBr36_10050 [Pyricularia pennisetigena]TLS22225.1 hypothetical protein PpBr36_10050 [Pyricularia pennisetigena]